MFFDNRRLLWLCGLLAFSLFLAACTGQVKDIPMDVQAQEINKTLKCPICPGVSIDQSPVELAEQMRTIVREKLADGESREQIIQFFVERYGESVLMAPPKRGFNLLIWLAPPVGLAAAGGLLYVVLWGMHRRAARTPVGAASIAMPDEEKLEPYLQRVDEEMRRFLEAPDFNDSGWSSGKSQPGLEEQARS